MNILTNNIEDDSQNVATIEKIKNQMQKKQNSNYKKGITQR